MTRQAHKKLSFGPAKMSPEALREMAAKVYERFRLLVRLYLWRALSLLLFRSRLAVTYESTILTDGGAAQLMRIYAIYSLARLLWIPYKHSPISKN